VHHDDATLLDVLRRRAVENGGTSVFVFLSHGAGEVAVEEALTFSQLEVRARSIAATLQQYCAPGDRALITCAPGLDYIAAFYGCVMAGVVAVPAYPPRNARHMGRLLAIAKDADATVVLTSSALSGRLGALSAASGSLPRQISIDTVPPELAKGWRDPRVTQSDLAMLQYTSGTVGTPKGIMVSHAQLLANADRIAQVGRLDTRTIGVYWVPPYHDMGLVAGLILPVTVGCRHILMSPVAFLQRPMRWLEAISNYRATHTSAPNFAYRLCTEQADAGEAAALDLGSLQAAFCGAEVVRHDTMQAFVARFRSSRLDWHCFRPAYGLAENVLLSTCPDAEVGPACLEVDANEVLAGHVTAVRRVPGFGEEAPSDGRRTLVSCGRPLPDHDIRIVDSGTRHELPAGRIGEIWLAGPCVADGYWGRPEETQSVFRARLVGGPSASSTSYLRSGDLGAILDGELYVLGRIKEMVIVRGRNLYATDLEATASASHRALGFDRTIAFAIEANGEEQVAIVHELSRGALRNLDAPGLFQAIRTALVAEHEIDPTAIILVRPAALPRTSSGKLQRGKARDQLKEGSLAAVAEWRASPQGGTQVDMERSRISADRLIDWLRDYASASINSFEIDERRTVPPSVVLDFARQGLFGLRVPVDEGGLGLSFRDAARLTEQLAAIDITLTLMLGGHNVLGLQTIMAAAPPALRQRLVPELASGRSLVAFALSEPSAGSNPRALKTVARAIGPGQWRLSGQKSWIGLGAWAHYVVVACRLHDEDDRFQGHGLFLVERGAKGFRPGPEALTLGLRGFVQSTLFFDDVAVEKGAMLGLPGEGLQIAMRTLLLGRLSLAAVCLGGMKRCAQLMSRYASRRLIGTGLLVDNGVTRQRLNLILGRIRAVEALIEHASDMLDAGQALPEDFYAVAKMSAPEFLWDTADWLVQMLGGRGYEEPNEAARLLRDARVFRIFEGPTETVGVYLGIRLLEEKSDLPGHLRLTLAADDLVERIERCRQDILAATAAGGQRSWNEADALGLARVATAATLVALVQWRAAESNNDATWRRAAAVLLDELVEAEASAARTARTELPEARDLTEAIANLVGDIGDLDKRAPNGNTEPDPYLLRAPESSPLVEVLRQRALQQYQGLGEPGFEPTVEHDVTDGNLLLVRDVVATLTGLPAAAVGADTAFDSLGIRTPPTSPSSSRTSRPPTFWGAKVSAR
jgi:acyl-CoA synthetase (AMP-forming)/AMP-acid ligase II/alkylation response protein AidB-like acyl-CoA dehydrogenase